MAMCCALLWHVCLPAVQALVISFCCCLQFTNGTTIDADLMPDTLHPNRFGFKMLLDQCFEPALYGDAAAKQAAAIGVGR